MTHQGERLVKMIGAAVDKLDDLPTLVPAPWPHRRGLVAAARRSGAVQAG